MEDSDDDAAYPPNPHLAPPFRHPPPPPRFSRRHADDEREDDDEEEDEDEDEEPGNHRRKREYGGGEEEDHDASSPDSRGKRKRIDKLALRFEFARRVPQVSHSKAPTRASPPDWSEDSTFALLDAWGDRYVQNGRKSIRSDEWSEVARKVSQFSKVNRSDAQCRNRVDTLKKKYKKEKASMAGHGNAGSRWVYFKKMDELMSLPSHQPTVGRQQQSLPPPPRLPCGIDAGKYVFATSTAPRNGFAGNDQMGDCQVDTGTEDESGEEDDDSEGLPQKWMNLSRSSGSSFKMLAESIQKFGEIYEKMENHKRQQIVELERMRTEFQRDLEAQKRLILERVHVDIAKLREEHAEEDDENEEDRDEDDNNSDGNSSAKNLSG